ncbi:MAG: sigma-70 family RNA polymerase sigma factor [Deltaproteobacteria bacterium]|nr:sigma-70 family RNA polymerase sigma factor [Deltaproteobacteria bacterium]
MPTDVELFEAWRAGDAKAGALLFDQYAREIYGFLRGKVRDTAAEDLVQETFVACLRAAEGFRGDASFRTYLFRAARSRLYNYLQRDKAKEDRIDFAVTTLHDLAPSATAAIAKRERDRVLLEALRRVPLEFQIAIELYYFEQLRGQQLAEVLGVPDGTARTRLRRARQLLHAQLMALEGGPALAETLGDLESWAAQIREHRND